MPRFHRPALLFLLALPWLPVRAEGRLVNESSQPLQVVMQGGSVLGASATVDITTDQAAPVAPAGAGLPTISEHKRFAWDAAPAPVWFKIDNANLRCAGAVATLPPGGSLVFTTSRTAMAAGSDEVTVNVFPGEEKEPGSDRFKTGGIQVTYRVCPDGTGQPAETLTQERIPATAAEPLSFQVLAGPGAAGLRVTDPAPPRKACIIL